MAASSPTRRNWTALIVAAMTVAIMVPLAGTAQGAVNLCVDVEIMTPYSVLDPQSDDPIFDLANGNSIQARVQVTDGNGSTFTDELGSFDCPGSGVVRTVTLEDDEGPGDFTYPPTVDTAGNGMSGTFTVTNNLSGLMRVGTFTLQATASNPGPVDQTSDYEYYHFGQRGFASMIECAPYEVTGVLNESRPIMATVADSWGDVVPGGEIDLKITGTHPQVIWDNAPADVNGELSSSYVGTMAGSDNGICYHDGNDNDVNDYSPPDAGYSGVYTTWVTANDLAGGDVEVDADSGDAPLPAADDFTQPGCNAEYYNDLNDPGGPPSDGLGHIQNDTYEQTRTGLPVNGVVNVCINAETDLDGTSTTVQGRAATLTITNGVGVIVDQDGNEVGATSSSPVWDYNDAIFFVKSIRPGTTELLGEMDGVTDTDAVTLGWDAPTAADARTIECTGGGWTTIPAANQVTCLVHDGLENGLSGVSVTFSRVNSDGATAGTPAPAVTNGSGKVTVPFSSATEGNTKVTASINSGDCAPPAPADGPGAFDLGKPAAQCADVLNIHWSDDKAPTGVDSDDGTDDGQGTAGEDGTYTVTITDEDGNPVDGVEVCVIVTGANPGTYTAVTDDDGVATFDIDTANSGDDDILICYDSDGDGETDTEVLGESIQRNGVVRFAGKDRRETAILASQEGFSSHANAAVSRAATAAQPAGAVVLARQDLFADALAGTPLAAANDAPLLLTPTADLHADTLAEIDRVLADGGTIYLLGGVSALSQSVEDALSSRWNVERLGGPTRFETAVLIAKATTTTPTTVLVTTGTNFADALTAGAAASAVDGVVLLSGNGTPSTATTAYLASTSAATVMAIGGPAATAYPALDSLVGTNRFETGLLVAEEFFTDPSVVGIARGYAFPDGLSGGAHIGNLGGPLLLVRGTDVVKGLTHPDNVDVTSYLEDNSASLHTAYIYGGNAAVAEVITAQLLAAIS